MKLKTRQITITAIMLAICIVSQFFKNLSVYLTGPIINAALILTAIYAGAACGVILSIITPITSFFITGSPIMAAIPAMFPCIMIGNIILVVAVALLRKQIRKNCRSSGIDRDRRCTESSVYGNPDLPYHSAKHAPGKYAAENACVTASVFCHTADHRSDRWCLRYHHFCCTSQNFTWRTGITRSVAA